MSRFGPDPQPFFDAVYQEAAPWDVGAEQPALAALFAEHPPAGPVLDVGCGTGDLAIALAARGLQVLGVDFVESAIAEAQARAAALPPDAAARLEFRVGDALRPARLGRRFGAVVDSGFFHLFDGDDRDRFVGELAEVLAPGGRYYLLAFTVAFAPEYAPRAVTEAELRALFAADRGWRILALRPAEFRNRVQSAPAIAACVERLPPAGA